MKYYLLCLYMFKIIYINVSIQVGKLPFKQPSYHPKISFFPFSFHQDPGPGTHSLASTLNRHAQVPKLPCMRASWISMRIMRCAIHLCKRPGNAYIILKDVHFSTYVLGTYTRIQQTYQQVYKVITI
jgi:hypothetical protein